MNRSINHRLVSLPTPKPPAFNNHYSNPNSQGALICQTPGFPGEYDNTTEQHTIAYSDRIDGWDHDRFKNTCEIAGTGDQGWAITLPQLSTKKLKEFAKVALDLPVTPKHVRIVHHYNVANGYSCPTVEAVFKKTSEGKQAGGML